MGSIIRDYPTGDYHRGTANVEVSDVQNDRLREGRPAARRNLWPREPSLETLLAGV